MAKHINLDKDVSKAISDLLGGIIITLDLARRQSGESEATFIAEDGDPSQMGKTVLATAGGQTLRQMMGSPKAPKKGGNGALMAAHSIKVVHGNSAATPNKGITFAWRYPKGLRKARTIEVATAILHPKDRYDRKVGARTAINNLLEGKFVTLPATRSPESMLKDMGNAFHIY